MDQFDWSEMVRWHCQHQRIKGEEAETVQIYNHLAQLNAMTQMIAPKRTE